MGRARHGMAFRHMVAASEESDDETPEAAWVRIQTIFGQYRFVALDRDPVSQSLVDAFDMKPELLPAVLELGFHLTSRDVRKILNAVVLRRGLTDAERREKLDVFQGMSSRLRFTFDHVLRLLKGDIEISTRVTADPITASGAIEFFATLDVEGAFDFSLSWVAPSCSQYLA
jgi:hypothetical protein